MKNRVSYAPRMAAGAFGERLAEVPEGAADRRAAAAQGGATRETWTFAAGGRPPTDAHRTRRLGRSPQRARHQVRVAINARTQGPSNGTLMAPAVGRRQVSPAAPRGLSQRTNLGSARRSRADSSFGKLSGRPTRPDPRTCCASAARPGECLLGTAASVVRAGAAGVPVDAAHGAFHRAGLTGHLLQGGGHGADRREATRSPFGLGDGWSPRLFEPTS
jgi:hypothetical protein